MNVVDVQHWVKAKESSVIGLNTPPWRRATSSAQDERLPSHRRMPSNTAAKLPRKRLRPTQITELWHHPTAPSGILPRGTAQPAASNKTLAPPSHPPRRIQNSEYRTPNTELWHHPSAGEERAEVGRSHCVITSPRCASSKTPAPPIHRCQGAHPVKHWQSRPSGTPPPGARRLRHHLRPDLVDGSATSVVEALYVGIQQDTGTPKAHPQGGRPATATVRRH